jgi:hypothetical protein
MSFILDALKKSESDRQRQSGPALFEVKVAPPRTRLPLWAIAIAALLVVNLGIVMWMVLRHSAAAVPANGTSAAATTPAMTGAPAGGAPLTAPPAQSAAATPPGPVPAAVPAPPVAAQAASMSPAPAPPPPVASGGPASAAPAALTAGAVAGGVAANAANARGSGNGESNPDDYAPAAESAPGAPGSTPTGHVRRGTASGVPLYQDASAGAQLPQLRLDLHVYAARPQDRFVMINMHKLREGDALPEGVQVESITPEGAVLSYNGSRFLLPRE